MKSYVPTLLLWVLAVCLAVFVDLGFHGEASAAAKGSPLERIFGSSKEIFGDSLFLKADEYYHGGVTKKFEEEDHRSDKEHDHKNCGHDHGEEASPGAVDWIAKINARVQSHEHYHLDQSKRRELLPFFALSTSLDPHNIEAILSIAYWLEVDFKKRNEALELLEKGIRDNPESWELESYLGSRYMQAKQFSLARRHYWQAIQKAEGKNLQYYEWVEIFYYLGEALSEMRRPADALIYYSKAFQKLGGRDSPLAIKLEEKIRQLSSNPV